MQKHISVVGAVITSDGLVLCAQRGATGELPGMWEFPGGKIESGESRQKPLSAKLRKNLVAAWKLDARLNQPDMNTISPQSR